MTEKRCRYCNQVKPLDKFVKAPRCKDGHLHQCTACRYARDKRRYDTAKNTENLRKYRASHATEYQNYQREYHREWDKANKHRYAEYRRRKAERREQAESRAKVDALIEFLKQKYLPQ